MSARIDYQETQVVLTLPKAIFGDDLMKRIIEWVEFLASAEQNSMTSDEAWSLSEEIKESWWAENGAQFLAKLGLS